MRCTFHASKMVYMNASPNLTHKKVFRNRKTQLYMNAPGSCISQNHVTPTWRQCLYGSGDTIRASVASKAPRNSGEAQRVSAGEELRTWSFSQSIFTDKKFFSQVGEDEISFLGRPRFMAAVWTLKSGSILADPCFERLLTIEKKTAHSTSEKTKLRPVSF